MHALPLALFLSVSMVCGRLSLALVCSTSTRTMYISDAGTPWWRHIITGVSTESNLSGCSSFFSDTQHTQPNFLVPEATDITC
jgi:hypothetical protein